MKKIALLILLASFLLAGCEQSRDEIYAHRAAEEYNHDEYMDGYGDGYADGYHNAYIELTGSPPPD